MIFVKIISFFSMLFLLAFCYQKPAFSNASIYGKWIFIRHYTGRLTDIKDKEKETKIWPDLDVYKTYDKNGDFFYLEDDMIEEGRFVFDSSRNVIKEFGKCNKKPDTTYLEIMYLDNNYLIYTDTNNYTFLYKRA